MQCHFCDRTEPLIKQCQHCGGQYRFAGFGTQMIEDDIKRLFPQAITSRIDRDAFTKMKNFKKKLRKLRKSKLILLLVHR